MTEYIYKGFKISYQIETTEQEQYKADGKVIFLQEHSKCILPTRFHTVLDSYQGAETEIKKLLENYVDFELKNFYAMEK